MRERQQLLLIQPLFKFCQDRFAKAVPELQDLIRGFTPGLLFCGIDLPDESESLGSRRVFTGLFRLFSGFSFLVRSFCDL